MGPEVPTYHAQMIIEIETFKKMAEAVKNYCKVK
jgi:hypothetical protein